MDANRNCMTTKYASAKKQPSVAHVWEEELPLPDILSLRMLDTSKKSITDKGQYLKYTRQLQTFYFYSIKFQIKHQNADYSKQQTARNR